MKHGFIKVAASSFNTSLADCKSNADKIIRITRDAYEQGVGLIVFPELCLTGSSCRDLFFSDALLSSASRELCRIAEETCDVDTIIIIGFPFVVNDKIYN